MRYTILQTRITNGKRVWEVDDADSLAEAFSMVDEFASHVGELVGFVLPCGSYNSYKQGYVNGNANDVYFVDILAKGHQSVDKEGRIHTRNYWAYGETIDTVGSMFER